MARGRTRAVARALARGQRGNMAQISLHRRINVELERRRAASRAALEERRAHAFAICPGLEELERSMAHAGLEASRKLVAGEVAAEEAHAALEGEAISYAERRAKMLKGAGLPHGYLDLAPGCARCGDVGLLRRGGPASEPEVCSCVRQLMADGRYEDSNLRAVGPASFEAFDASLFSSQPDVAKYGRGESPRENIIDILNSARQYVRALLNGEYENLCFFGRTGTGKTFMAAAIASAAISGGATALYQTAPALFGAITEHRMRLYRDEQYSDIRYRQILETRLLVIDDLGTESMTDARYAEFITLLNSRLSQAAPRRSTIIVTNMDIRSLSDTYDERISSRIAGSFRFVPFYGDDIRLVRSKPDLIK